MNMTLKGCHVEKITKPYMEVEIVGLFVWKLGYDEKAIAFQGVVKGQGKVQTQKMALLDVWVGIHFIVSGYKILKMSILSQKKLCKDG